MATASSMVIRALRLIGEKEVGGSLSSAEQTAYLSDLNAMMESWSLERLMCYHEVEDSKALTVSDASYTIGSGGDWNTTRPTTITQAWIRDSSNLDSPVEIINQQAYNLIVQKTVDGTYPQYLYYDTAYSTARGTIYIYPEPSAALTLYITSWKQLTQFATIGETVALPPGYQRAIEFNLAVELAGGFKSVSAEVAKIARESKAAIKSFNQPSVFMRLDAGLVNAAGSSILTGP